MTSNCVTNRLVLSVKCRSDVHGAAASKKGRKGRLVLSVKCRSDVHGAAASKKGRKGRLVLSVGCGKQRSITRCSLCRC
jgi:hypothetical protein